MSLPAPSAHIVAFAPTLREAGFAASPDQSMTLLAALDVLDLDGLEDIRRAAIAVFGPGPDRRAEFEALFDAHFLGRRRVTRSEVEDDVTVAEDDPQTHRALDGDPDDGPGQAAALISGGAERVINADPNATLRRFQRLAPRRLPLRVTRRLTSARNGRVVDRAGVMREALRMDGEVLNLPQKARISRLRPLLILIDVSGSMKDQTEMALRFAHSAMRLPARVEVFTLGTELTRLTRALRPRNAAQALSAAAALVPDFDGGTQLGAVLARFLSVPRFVGFARGAVVVTLSDGLEIGSADLLVAGARRLSRICAAHLWFTPLAPSNRAFTPQTEALRRLAPFVDEFGCARSMNAICSHLLGDSAPAFREVS